MPTCPSCGQENPEGAPRTSSLARNARSSRSSSPIWSASQAARSCSTPRTSAECSRPITRASARRSSVSAALGRSDELRVLSELARISTPWLDAARAYGSGELEQAAAVLGQIGAAPDEAFVRLRAAEALVRGGRRAEADAQLQQALSFYRAVGATAYVREAEGLFAASA